MISVSDVSFKFAMGWISVSDYRISLKRKIEYCIPTQLVSRIRLGSKVSSIRSRRLMDLRM